MSRFRNQKTQKSLNLKYVFGVWNQLDKHYYYEILLFFLSAIFALFDSQWGLQPMLFTPGFDKETLSLWHIFNPTSTCKHAT